MSCGCLSQGAISRGLKYLQSIAGYTLALPSERVWVVGTQALRLAENRRSFCEHVETMLGHPVDIISGEREAELVFNAVRYPIDPEQYDSPVLVVDIGGGSTELAVGRGKAVSWSKSVPVGCVLMLKQFDSGVISESSFDAAYQVALARFLEVKLNCPVFSSVIGSSGTLLAVEQVLMTKGWSQGGINRKGLVLLKSALLAFDHIEGC